MSAPPRLVLVTGSRALVGNATASAWLVSRLDELAPSLVVAGDARGPDVWAADWARSRRVVLRCYDLAGRVVDGERVACGQWTDDAPPARDAGRALWAAWCLHRDRVMVQHVARRADRYAATVLALTSRSSDTKGTAFTVGRAKAAGLAVVAEAWS